MTAIVHVVARTDVNHREYGPTPAQSPRQEGKEEDKKQAQAAPAQQSSFWSSLSSFCCHYCCCCCCCCTDDSSDTYTPPASQNFEAMQKLYVDFDTSRFAKEFISTERMNEFNDLLAKCKQEAGQLTGKAQTFRNGEITIWNNFFNNLLFDQTQNLVLQIQTANQTRRKSISHKAVSSRANVSYDTYVLSFEGHFELCKKKAQETDDFKFRGQIRVWQSFANGLGKKT